MSWSHFHHEADLGLRGAGPDMASAFEEIALALTAAITEPDSVVAKEIVNLECRAPDSETLLVDWLNALIYEMAVRKMLFRDFDVAITDGDLHARVRGEPVDRARHQPAVEVKGATYTELLVDESGDECVVQCVVDV